MKLEKELEMLGYSYYEPTANEYKNLRKEYNPATLLFITLIALFGISLFFVMFYTDKLQLVFGS